MKRIPRFRLPYGGATFTVLLLAVTAPAAFGQAQPSDTSAAGIALYQALVKFDLSGGTAQETWS